MSDYSMEDKKGIIKMQFDLLKGMLQETGMIIGFDKDKNEFVFLDRKKYINGKAEGFKIDFNELVY